jgi:hypothetical protein
MKAVDHVVKCVILLELVLAGCLASAAPQAQTQPVAPPSLGELARKVRAERAEQHLKNVPLYTNDNLPPGPGEIGELGPGGPGGQQAIVSLAAKQASVEKQQIEKLRYDLAKAQQRLQMHQRELSVLEQQLAQNNIQYYPDPNQALLQEYNRSDINTLTENISEKKQQIADNQQTVDNLQSELQNAQARWGWVTAGQGNNAAPSPPPIMAKQGTEAYWQAKLDRAREQLETTKEQEKLAQDELSLLKIQQIRTLDPNSQAGLAAAVSAKQGEVTSAQQAVQQAQKQLDDVQQAMEHSGAPPDESGKQ